MNQWYFSGTYERSCFGSSMEALVHISLPIREIPVGRLIELVSKNSYNRFLLFRILITLTLFVSLFNLKLQENNKNPSQEPYPVPKEVWHLVDRLYRHGIKTPGLFETPGLHSEIIAIRDWLDESSQDPMRILFIS